MQLRKKGRVTSKRVGTLKRNKEKSHPKWGLVSRRKVQNKKRKG